MRPNRCREPDALQLLTRAVSPGDAEDLLADIAQALDRAADHSPICDVASASAKARWTAQAARQDARRELCAEPA